MNWKIIAGFVAFTAIYGWVGTMDMKEEQRQAEHYVEMVCAGAWPDYDNRNPNCEDQG
jgi:hypothetical protein